MQPKAKDAQMFLYGFKTLQKKKKKERKKEILQFMGEAC